MNNGREVQVDQFAQNVFLNEIEHQCEFALAAYDAMQKSSDPGVIFYHVQAFLVSGANVSKIIFPAARGSKEFKDHCNLRGEQLRTLLNLDQCSILANRNLRDHFEHIDERIQVWADRPGPKNFIDRNVLIGTTLAKSVTIAGPAVDFFRNFNSPPPKVDFLGEEYPLRPIAEALQVLLARTREIQAAEWYSRSRTPQSDRPSSS